MFDVRPADPPISIDIPNGSTMQADTVATLDIPFFSTPALTAHVLPDITTSLLSVGQLADDGCYIVFDADEASIMRSPPTFTGPVELLASRQRNGARLYVTPIPGTKATGASATTISAYPTHSANAITTTTSIRKQIAWIHAALGSPTHSTLLAAIDAGYLTTIPHLTSRNVRRYLPASKPMVQGHLDQSRAHQNSTQPRLPPPPIVPPTSTPPDSTDESPTDLRPPLADPPALTTAHLYAACVPMTGQIYTDPTGKFLCPSTAGNTDMLVLYDYDTNAILVEPMKGKSAPVIIAAYTKALEVLTRRGHKPRLQKLDNEASTALLNFIEQSDIDFQLAPPQTHRRNAAERAIRTFKNHFIAMLCSTDKDFPLKLWDRLLPQALISLNLVRGSRVNPSLSAYAQLFGAFDYNRTPLAPPGIRILIHEKPAVRETWAPHAVDGWYIGPAMFHYRCFRVWATETQAERISDTVAWFPTKLELPQASPLEEAAAAARDLIDALTRAHPGVPLLELSDSNRNALRQLAEIFADPQHQPPPVLDEDDAIPAPPAPLAPPAPPPGFPPLGAPPTPPLQRVAGDEQRVAPPPPPTSEQRVGAPAGPPQPPGTVAFAPEVNFQPGPALPQDTTYAQLTVNPGQRRRRKKAAKQAAAKQPPAPATAPPVAPIVPPPVAPPAVPAVAPVALPVAALPAPPTHSHNTRRRARLNACTTASADILHTANSVIDPITGDSLEYRHLRQGPDRALWLNAAANELGRLTNGVGSQMPTGTQTMRYIPIEELPPGRVATYSRIVASLRPNKTETHRIRLTVGGNRIHYEGNKSTPVATLETVKLLLNSVLSTPDAQFCTADIKDFYLNTPMPQYEYMRIPIVDIPPVIMEQYQLTKLVHNQHVYVEIQKGMYGLPQAGILAHERLVAHLAKYGYTPTRHTPGLFRHATRPIVFCLVVDDFGIQYTGREHAEHLLGALAALYTITTDWTGNRYVGLTLDWDFAARTMDFSMPGYIANALKKFNHPTPVTPQHSPHSWTAPQYGAKTQLTNPVDTSAKLDPAGVKRLQEVVGTLLYYARAVDSTMLVALGTLASAQTKATAATNIAINHLLDYCATHPDATVRYTASDMCLHVHSDASYLSEADSRSRAGGYFFLSAAPPQQPPPVTATPPPINGAVHVHSSIIRAVMSSAAEAEIGALFFNAKEATSLRTTLAELGHPQLATPIQTDNQCAAGIANNTVKQRRSKAIDMRFYWIQDRAANGEFLIHWRPGIENLADYFTKHHATTHHQAMRPQYLRPNAPSHTLQSGCVILGAPGGTPAHSGPAMCVLQRLPTSALRPYPRYSAIRYELDHT